MNRKIVNTGPTQRSARGLSRRWHQLGVASICGAVALWLALSAGALARGPGATGGETGTGSGIHGRATTPHSYQPFAWYTGQIGSVSGQHSFALGVLIDRRGATPKVASILGTVPSYYCGATAVDGLDLDFDLIDAHREAPIHGGAFRADNLTSVPPIFTYLMTGTVTGNVRIPARGPGKGASTITGTLSPDDCPSVQLPYHLKFRRTYSGIAPRGGGPE